MKFPNLAGHPVVDLVARNELQAAGIEILEAEALRSGEVNTKVYGHLDPVGWSFTRAWTYWVARGPGLPLDVSWQLHKEHGTEVRVNGDCTCPSPAANKGFAVSFYHVDTPEGLKALADAIKHVYAAHGGERE